MIAALTMMPENSLLPLDVPTIIDKLTSQLDHDDSVLAFDADGTLWTGDVSDDVFLTACRDHWLLEAARPALAHEAQRAGLDREGSASELALALFRSQPNGKIADVDLFALMAWCYAGRTISELLGYAAAILTSARIDTRIRPEILQILDWARRRNIATFVVSASPTPIVTWAASKWGFSPDRVIGTQPKMQGSLIVPGIVDEVPFGANKCKLLRRLTGSRGWLASFGDSEYDFDMLKSAKCPVAVSPKPSLLARLRPLRHAIVLRTGP